MLLRQIKDALANNNDWNRQSHKPKNCSCFKHVSRLQSDVASSASHGAIVSILCPAAFFAGWAVGVDRTFGNRHTAGDQVADAVLPVGPFHRLTRLKEWILKQNCITFFFSVEILSKRLDFLLENSLGNDRKLTTLKTAGG